MSRSLIDPDVLQSLREMQTSEDPHFVKNYYTSVLETLSKHLPGLKEAISKNNFRTYNVIRASGGEIF